MTVLTILSPDTGSRIELYGSYPPSANASFVTQYPGKSPFAKVMTWVSE